MSEPFKDKPDFINAEGTKWWRDILLEAYANKKGLTDATCWYVETKDKERTIVCVMNNEVIVEDKTLDGFGCKLDVLGFLQQEDQKEKNNGKGKEKRRNGVRKNRKS